MKLKLEIRRISINMRTEEAGEALKNRWLRKRTSLELEYFVMHVVGKSDKIKWDLVENGSKYILGQKEDKKFIMEIIRWIQEAENKARPRIDKSRPTREGKYRRYGEA